MAWNFAQARPQALLPKRDGKFAGRRALRQSRRNLGRALFSVDCDELAHRRAERGLSESVDIDAVERGQRERFADIAEGGEPRVRIAALLKRVGHDGRHNMHFRSMRRQWRRQSFKRVNGDGTCGSLQKRIEPALQTSSFLKWL